MALHPKIPIARRKVCKRQPYLARIVYKLVPREVPSVRTMSVSAGGVLSYAPAALDRWSADEAAAVYCHETQHVQRDHHGRAKGREPKRWNIAGDLEINGSMRRAGWRLPPEGLFPEAFRFPVGMLAEWYYDALTDEQVASVPDLPECGGGAGNPSPDEQQPGPERSQVDLQIARHDAAEAVKDHVKARGQDSVPEDLVVWAGATLAPPTVDWRTVLGRDARRAVADSVGSGAFTYRIPSRRQAGIGYGVGCPVLPGLRRPRPLIAFVADTSGSMEEDGGYVLSEAPAVLEAAGGDLIFIAADSAVHERARVCTLAQMRGLLRGGGGTDFRPAFALLERERVDVAVYATDGCVGPDDLPAYPPRMRVIWLIVPGGRRPPCNWGQVVRIPENR